LVELATIPTDLSPETRIADAFGVPTAELAGFVGDTRVLVVLDGCERVIEPCAALVADLLSRCPGLRFLTTSREALRVPGEVTFRVRPLPTPEPWADSRRILRSDAVRLFIERARDTTPRFAPRAADIGLVAEICRRSDGLPLAIELAARHVGNRPLDTLPGDLTDPALTAAIDHGYRLLTSAEQAALRRLSVLPGGFDLKAAQAVCTGPCVEPDDVVRLVCALEARSMISATTCAEDTVRFHQLRCVRAYATQRLIDAGEVAASEEKAVAWLCHRAETLTRELYFGDSAPSALSSERDNLAAALDFPAARDDDRHALLAVALARVLWQRQQATAARRVLDAVRDQVHRSRWHGDALALSALAASAQADHEHALRFAQRAVRIQRAAPDRPFGWARALEALGFVRACRGEFTDAASAYVECRDIVLAAGKPLDVAECEHCLAWTLLMAGKPAEAKRFLDGIRPVLTAAPLRSRVAVTNTVGTLHLAEGDDEGARTAFTTVLRSAPAGDHLTSYALDGLAILAARRDDARRTIALTTAAAVIRRRCGVRVSTTWQDWVDRATATATRSLGQDRTAAAAATGRRLHGDRLLAYALRDTPDGDTRPPGSDPCDGALTRRELQIAGLVADGRTDREIAEDLGLAVRTVRAHLTSIHQKLDLRSRIQLAVWTTRRAADAR